MTSAGEFEIIIQNKTGVEIKATKFEYMDGSRSKNENIFFGGNDRIGNNEERRYTRTLQGVGGEMTSFTVTYQHRVGNNWSGNHVAQTDRFECNDREQKVVVLTD
ncbi:hypothetical protein [Actinoplanes utahensis]|uniref:Uncharacterized protein n=1 Tax=Actinoplanes utahensis TaxID=1869 RepID=A0A0A6UGP7_ACTUT|nr:hypothetical protein [Actinoplanes utahensis]KHD74248.1 hypothetical protein MB27_29945 [Actinoplanes utahensis]GIF35480.1 hypothetical protein Aut01nite_84660 [Actinoplanes utahensis]